MNKKIVGSKDAADKLVKNIRRRTSRKYSASEKIRIVLAGLRGEESIAALCQREGIAESLYYKWSKEFLEAGKRRLSGDTERYGRAEKMVTDRLRSYGAARRELRCPTKQETGRWLNNRAENSRQPFRRKERAMQRFRQMRSLQKFASGHASVFNHFNQDRSHIHRGHFKQSRNAALIEWRGLLAG